MCVCVSECVYVCECVCVCVCVCAGHKIQFSKFMSYYVLLEE